MEKFENGVYSIDDTKKSPNLTDIAFAFRNAQLKDAEKFVAIIRGMRFGYDERKRNIYPLKDAQYQVLREPVDKLIEIDDDKVVVDEPIEEKTIEKEPEISPISAETETLGKELPEEDEIGEKEPNLEEFEPIKEETIVVSEEPTEISVDEILAEYEKQADEMIEKDFGDNEANDEKTAREKELEDKLKEKEEELETLKVEHFKSQKVLQLVLKFNADLINALK